MARTRPLLPTASAGGKAKPKITDADWKRIERAYGNPLSRDVRNKIRETTEDYLEWAVFELNAEPQSEAINRIKVIHKAASRASGALLNQDQSDVVRGYVKCLILDKLRLDRFPEREKKEPLRYIADILRSLSVACKLSLQELNGTTNEGFRKGDCWELWVRQLTKIAKKNGLPNGVRSDSDKQKGDAPSPFVTLVRELQACLPAEYRRRSLSDIALAQAINRARRRLRPLTAREEQRAKQQAVGLADAVNAATASTEAEIFHEAIGGDPFDGSTNSTQARNRARAARRDKLPRVPRRNKSRPPL